MSESSAVLQETGAAVRSCSSSNPSWSGYAALAGRVTTVRAEQTAGWQCGAVALKGHGS